MCKVLIHSVSNLCWMSSSIVCHKGPENQPFQDRPEPKNSRKFFSTVKSKVSPVKIAIRPDCVSAARSYINMFRHASRLHLHSRFRRIVLWLAVNDPKTWFLRNKIVYHIRCHCLSRLTTGKWLSHQRRQLDASMSILVQPWQISTFSVRVFMQVPHIQCVTCQMGWSNKDM